MQILCKSRLYSHVYNKTGDVHDIMRFDDHVDIIYLERSENIYPSENIESVT